MSVAQQESHPVIPIDIAFERARVTALANIAFSNDEYAEADSLFRVAIDIAAPLRSYPYIRSCVAAFLNKDTVRAKEMMAMAISTGATPSDVKEILADIPAKAASGVADLLTECQERCSAIFGCRVDLIEYMFIQQLLFSDQVIREVPMSAVDERVFLKYMGSVDSTNFRSLVAHVEINGWPTFSTIGNLSSMLPLLLMHNIGLPHASEEDWVIIRGAIQRSVDEGAEDGFVIAMVNDLFAQRQGLPQIYGTQSDGWDSTPTFYEIKDCQHVDQRRRLLGLIPLDLDARRRGLELPACYGK